MSELFYPTVKRHFNSLFNSDPFDFFDSSFFPTSYRNQKPNRGYVTTPMANIYKNESIELAAPGFSRDEFDMKIDDGVLQVSVTTEDGKNEKNNLHTREWKYASFTRSWSLPETAVVDSVSARYEAGILYVNIPVHSEKSAKRTITVE